MKTAIIGYGKMGKIREKAMQEDGRFELVKIYEPNFEGELPDGVVSVEDEYEIINDASIDALFVCIGLPDRILYPLSKD